MTLLITYTSNRKRCNRVITDFEKMECTTRLLYFYKRGNELSEFTINVDYVKLIKFIEGD